MMATGERDGRPMSERDFNAELRAEEVSRQAEGIPAGIRRSVWARLQPAMHGRPAADDGDAAPRGAAARRWRLGAIAGTATLAAVGVLVAVTALRPAARLGDLEMTRRSDDLVARVDGGLVAIERGAAALVDRPSGLTIETAGAVSLRRESRGVRLVRGRIDVTAAHRPAGAEPSAILVSDGAIEVMGTAFTVVQDAAGGRVALREGRIRFRATDGAVVGLRPGEALAWPLPATSPAAPAQPAAPQPPAPHAAPHATKPTPRGAPARGAPAPADRPATDEALLDHIEELRSRHQFEEAARALRRALPAQPEPMRERLSFELGSLLTHQIRDARRACAQWAWHHRHFPDGRYRDEVARARRSLGCASPSAAP
jgi:transmembrane sensor